MKICCNKKCSHAGKMQPLDNFYKDIRMPDNKAPECKDCRIARTKMHIKRRTENYHNYFSNFIG